jgi:methionyl-tRNA synthetase
MRRCMVFSFKRFNRNLYFNKFLIAQEQYISEPNGWVDLDYAPRFTSDGLKYVMILPVDQGASGKFKHVVVRNRINNDTKPVTSGQWEVVDFLFWEETNNTA